MDPTTASICIGLAPALALGIWLGNRRNSASFRPAPLPPGPKGLPIVGSTFSIDSTNPGWTFIEWEQEYGEIVHCQYFGRDVIILNSKHIAEDLLERRSRIYSDRAGYSALASYGILFDTAMIPYGDEWRTHRKLYKQIMRQTAVPTYHTAFASNACKLVSDLTALPDRYPSHLDSYSAGNIMHVVCGQEIEDRDEVVGLVARTAERFVRITADRFVATVNVFPFLKYIPSWLPGGIFNALDSMKLNESLGRVLHRLLSQQDADGNFLLRQLKEHVEEDIIQRSVKDVCTTSFVAGLDTTSCTLLIFVLTMLLFPDAQMNAQLEIDCVVGAHRFPSFEDRPSLPYVEAVLREVMRWRPVTPLGIPHCAMEDDMYEGYFIPKGTTIVALGGGMARHYDNPDKFIPERFLNPDGSLNDDNMGYVFGFGRRICPGRYVADASVWIAMATILARLRIEPEKDEEGKDIKVEPEWVTGLTCHPKQFPCRFTPRQAAS